MDVQLIKNALEPVIVKDGYLLSSIKIERQGKDTYLRIEIDAEGRFISLDEIILMSEKLSVLLDSIVEDDTPYILDCSSAGAEKKLNIDKLAPYLNHYVRVILKDPKKGVNALEGYLENESIDSLTIRVNYKGRIKSETILKTNIKQVNLAIKV